MPVRRYHPRFTPEPLTAFRPARARNAGQSHRHHQHRIPGQLMLIMAIGPLPDALKPGIHGVRAHWIRGFTASERTGSGDSLRRNALDPGFHGVPLSRLRTVTLPAARTAMLLSGN